MKKLKRSSRADEHNQKKEKRLKRIIILLAILIFGLIFTVIIFLSNNKKLNNFVTLRTVELSISEGSLFSAYKNGIIKYNRDGAQAFSSEGKQLWTVSYNLKEPIADTNGSFAAIGEFNGKTAYIISGSGDTKQITVPYPIVDIEVASQGVCSILMNNGSQDFIYFYTLDNIDFIAEIKTVAAQDGFPISITLSEDGKKLITSYVKSDTDTIASEVTFHNLGDVGQNYIERLVGAFPLTNEFVAKVEFINNDIATAFKENGLYLYSFKEVPEVILSESYDSDILSCFYSRDYIGIILDNTTGVNLKRCIIYDLNGKKLADKAIDFAYDGIAASNDYVVFYDSTSCYVMNTKGKEVFNDRFEEKINLLFTGKSSTQFIALTDVAMNTIQMVETKEE